MVVINGHGVKLLEALLQLHKENRLELSVEVSARVNGRQIKLQEPSVFLNDTAGHESIINVITRSRHLLRGYFAEVEEDDPPGVFAVYIRKVDKDECFVIPYNDILAFFYER